MYSALTKISTTRFTIAMYKYKHQVKGSNITRNNYNNIQTHAFKQLSHHTVHTQKSILNTRNKHQYDWIRARAHAHTRMHTHTHTHACIHTHTHACTHTHTHSCIHKHTHTEHLAGTDDQYADLKRWVLRHLMRDP